MDEFSKQLWKLAAKPEYGSTDYKTWIGQDDFIAFLQRVRKEPEVVLFASISPFIFLHTVLVPTRLVTPPDIDDLDRWSCNPSSSWSISARDGKRPSITLSAPMTFAGSKTLARGEQLVFARSFDGRQENQSYIELAQRFAQAFDLHWVPERDAFSRFDHRGDIEDVVRVITRPHEGRVVTALRTVFDEYLIMTKQVGLMLYDSTRYESKNFSGWAGHTQTTRNQNGDIHYRIGLIPDVASYITGFQIIRPALSKLEIIRRHTSGNLHDRKYAEFITYDWKHKTIRECSCDPQYLGNYFVKSDFPFEISPVFFRPEVLQKYKSDTEKYQLGDRSISCRHAWHLQTYDINDAGQVHTYLKYLSHLPYEEQLYWKSCNEAPKAPISKRSFASDFEGQWDLEYDPLRSLKEFLSDLVESKVSWWTLRANELLENLHYPVTSSMDEWKNEIHTLDKLLIEGLVVTDLRLKAKKLGSMAKPEWKSLKLLEEILSQAGLELDRIRELIDPLREIHFLRTKLSGHASGQEAKALRIKILKTEKSYPGHFRNLVAKCDTAIRALKTKLDMLQTETI